MTTWRLSRLTFALIPIALSSVAWHPQAAQSEQDTRTPTVANLAWITGRWQTAAGRTQSEEHWTHVAGNTMLGVSRTIAGGKTVFFEFLRIEARPDGIYYVALPQGRAGTDFKLTKLEG